MNFFHRVYYWFADRIADIGAFFRFGFKNRIKAVFSWIGGQFFKVQMWGEAIPSSHRARRQETMESIERLRTEVMSVASNIADAIWSLFTSPREGVRKLGDLWDRVRSLSPKEIIVILWRSYVAMVSQIALMLEGLYFRWLSMRPVLRILSCVLLVGFIALAASTGILIKEAKNYRSKMLIAEADVLEGQAYEVKAYQRLRSAALLNPDDEAILKRTMESAHSLGTAEAVWWGEQLSKRQNYSAESVKNLANYAIDFRQYSKGAKYLSKLQALHPDTPEAIDLELRILLSQGHRARALTYATRILQSGKESPIAHELYLNLSNRNDPDTIAKLKEHYQQNLFRDDKIGQHIRRITLRPGVSADSSIQHDYAAILEFMVQNDESDREQIALAAGRAYEAGQLDRESAIEKMTSEYALDEVEDREKALMALNFFRLGGVSDQFIQEGDLERHQGIAREWVRNLVLSDQPALDQAMAMLDLNLDDNALSFADKSFWRSIISLVKNDHEQFVIDLAIALEDATSEEWDYMESIILSYTTQSQQLVFYRELFGQVENDPYTIKQYIELLYKMGHNYELKALLKKVPLKAYRGDPLSLSMMIYFKASYKLDLANCRYLAEDMVEEFPEFYLGQITLAFAYFQSGRPDLARAMLKDSINPFKPDQMALHHRFAYAIVMDDEQYLPSSTEFATLPPEIAAMKQPQTEQDLSMIEDGQKTPN